MQMYEKHIMFKIIKFFEHEKEKFLHDISFIDEDVLNKLRELLNDYYLAKSNLDNKIIEADNSFELKKGEHELALDELNREYAGRFKTLLDGYVWDGFYDYIGKVTNESLSEINEAKQDLLNNVDAEFDIKQGRGNSLTSVISQDASTKEIENLERNLFVENTNLVTSWIQGTIATTGIDSNSETRCRTNFMTIDGCYAKIQPKTGYSVGVRIYTENSVESFVGSMSFSENEQVLFDSGKYYRLIIKNVNDGVINANDIPSDALTIKIYQSTDKSLTQEGKSADAKKVGDTLNAINANNLMNNTLIPSVTTKASRPRINDDGYLSGTRCNLTPAEHGIKATSTSANRFGVAWCSDNLSGLKNGKSYTLGFDGEVKMFNPSGTQSTRYFSVYYCEGDENDILPTLADVSSSNCQSRKSLITIEHTNKDVVLKEHCSFTFKIGENAKKFALYITGSSTTGGDYKVGSYMQLSNISLRETLEDVRWYPSIQDITANSLNNDIVSRNDPENMMVKLQQMKRRTRTGSNDFGRIPLCLLHFSDIHGDAECLKNVVEFKNHYSDFIDDIIHTGDSVENTSEDGVDFWVNTAGSEKILNTIGNHDTRVEDGSSYSWDGLSMDGCYNNYFAPFIDSWNVNHESGKTYYYKDYNSNKVRLIVLDIMHQTADQLNWFTETLASALTNSMHVIVAVHAKAHWLITPFDTTWDDKIHAPSYQAGYNDTSKYKGTSYPSNLSNDYANAVDEFIDDGGDFVCWIHGHTHFKIFATLDSHPRQLNVSVSNAGGADHARTYVWDRVVDTKSMDDFNVLAIDTSAKILRIIKVGVNYDRYMRYVDTISYDYNSHNLIYTN